ncbi:glycoside hydrolase family 30 protein [Pedobacter duraquae]|uniref:Glucosylceramidase n=1 Tax=Pedobacter duraquae TaxID=425511 RepID=A0A4V3C437_9SPHI|nr:glycoside hydrolase family 30 protein [Pedobacter duraquae]TDO24478.1 glucosylceramidase [Pedobacter duraquae]
MRSNYTRASLVIALAISVAGSLTSKAQKVEWVSTTATAKWEVQKDSKISRDGVADATVFTEKPRQTIEGFGACFNELGWTSLSALSATDRSSIFKELFAPGVGANFTVFRMPIGANDFSRQWYSYNETAGDFEMKNFSIDNDKETLIPFIKSALKYNPELKLWASPWSPPQWMKYNKHYAGAAFPKNGVTAWRDLRFNFAGLDNGIQPNQVGKAGTNMFIQEPQYFEAYARYFSKFIQAYKNEGIKIAMVMPQNEFNSPQTFPSATWTAKGLSDFVSYLGPEMNKLGVDIFMGTVEKGNPALVDTVLTTEKSGGFIKGAGFQWDGKMAIGDIHSRYPELPLYQTEHECGNGLNDWAYAKYSWTLLQQYLNNGVKTYEYWNLSLPVGGKSTWGWYQNSLITVDEKAKTYTYNYEYYLMKHFSHYVKAGAKYLETSGLDKNIIAFRNPDKSVVVLVHNEAATDRKVNIKIGGFSVSATLKGDSFNTLLIKG